MGYGQWWKALEKLAIELRKKGVEIPDDVMINLKSAKTMISVYAADPSCFESVPAIERYMLNVESTLINGARKSLGKAATERWIGKLGEAREREEQQPKASAARFPIGVPKSEHWIRVLPSGSIREKDIMSLTKELGLHCKKQQDGYIVVYGAKNTISKFVKSMAGKCRPSRKT